MMIRSIAAVAGLSVAAAASLGQGQLLYDIDFSEPFHTFGSPAVIDSGGTPRQGFSEYPFTSPGDEPVVDGVFDLRAMTGGVALFDANAQARLNIEDGAFPIAGADYDVYTLEFDASISEGGGLTVFFDAPAINRFYMGTDFPADGTGIITDGSGPTFGNEIGEFTYGEFLAVTVTLDTVNQRWRVEVDGEVLIQGPVQNAVDEVRNVRFLAGEVVYLDNITLRGSYLECGSADLNEDGLLDLGDVTTFVESFLAGCD